MTVRVESNSYLTEEQHRVYTLREALERNGGTPVGFLELLAAVIAEDTWRKVPAGVNREEPFDDFSEFLEAKPPFGLGAKVSDIRVLLRLQHPHEGVAHIREQMDGMRAAVRELLGPDPEDDPIARDAAAFGAFAQHGGWAFGLMVARSVLKSGGPRPGKVVREPDGQDGKPSGSDADAGKVSFKEFASRAGCDTDKVSRYYNAWERAAEKKLVAHSSELTPGQDVELPAAETWGQFYLFYETSSDRRENVAAEAEAAGTSYKKAVEITANRPAMRAAILGDPKTAEAARDALMERPEVRAAVMAKALADPVIRKEAAVEARRIEQADFVRHIAQDGKAKTPAGQLISLPPVAREEAAARLAVVENPAATPEDVSAAYATMQALIAQTVEEDPEIHTREQRTRLRKTLSATAKSIESIKPDDLAAVADEELRSAIGSLQSKINGLVAALPEPAADLRTAGEWVG
ncbi:hypothetical protein [Kitasatospora sp. NPDC002040]|uniref:hypothetical protein n=1 Tax=Kitasatospora sp. NPDC002040 TaxID=3154661 RepID=UPI00332A76EC